jgi:dTMP kinase
MTRGKFITLEGVDGAGKSSHLEWIAGLCRAAGHDLVVTREPGGTPLGEQLRALVLDCPMDIETETLLIFAARKEHLARVIIPALNAGRWVLSDRFTDATFAYQGAGRGLERNRIAVLEDWVQQGLHPDLTLVFDLPVEIARQRLERSAGKGDRFEQEDAAFFNRVREAYLWRARDNPHRVRIIDADRPMGEIKEELKEVVSTIC